MTIKQSDFPLNDKGEEAFAVITTGGVEYPFWRIMTGWGAVVAGQDYLILNMDDKEEVEQKPGFHASYVLYTNRVLTEDEWLDVIGQMHFDGYKAVLFHVNWNTGSEFEFEHPLNFSGRHCLTYQGNLSQGVVKQ